MSELFLNGLDDVASLLIGDCDTWFSMLMCSSDDSFTGLMIFDDSLAFKICASVAAYSRLPKSRAKSELKVTLFKTWCCRFSRDDLTAAGGNDYIIPLDVENIYWFSKFLRPAKTFDDCVFSGLKFLVELLSYFFISTSTNTCPFFNG